MAIPRPARDHELIDAVDEFPRIAFSGELWRVAREGRDPLVASRSNSRWCDGGFDVLYTAAARDGAIAEVHALLSLQPVFPSKIRFFVHRLEVRTTETLRLADLPTLARLGVDVAKYRERDYSKTQAIADAAFFLGFDGLIAPSARWDCAVAALFADRTGPENLVLAHSEPDAIDWKSWRGAAGGAP